jgi:hypothetical protein
MTRQYDYEYEDLTKSMELVEKLKEENAKLKKALSQKILLVEDGSVDVDKLEQDGFYVIIYREGSKPPMWLELEKGGAK